MGTGVRKKMSHTEAQRPQRKRHFLCKKLRKLKVQKIMSMKGKLSFELTADEIRHYER